MSLQEGYKLLEYIESTGLQYLDTEIVPALGYTAELGFVATYNAANAESWVLGVFDMNATGYPRMRAGIVSGAYYTDSANGFSYNGTIGSYTVASGGVSRSGCTLSLYLFAQHEKSGASYVANSKYRLLYCKIRNSSGVLVRDYTPALNISNVAGLWDDVSGRFFSSATSTPFVAGPEIITVPATPTNFRVESVFGSLVSFAWSPSNNALGYRLYRSGQLLADTEETSVSVTVEPFASAVFTLTAYNENGEGAETELTYFNAPDNPILFLVTDRTQQDVTERNQKGYYATSDLNRVGYAVEYLTDRLKHIGISVTVSPSTEWTDADWATPTVMAAYLNDIRTMRSALTLISTTPSAPTDMERMTFAEANDIESILVALDAHITRMLAIVDAGWATGTAYTGFYTKEAY